MKKLLFLTLVAFSVSANAKINAEDIFAGIFDVILDQIEKDKNGHVVLPEDNKVILKDLGDRIILGRVALREGGSVDSLNLPRCIFGENKVVSALRFRVDASDVVVSKVKITYQNDVSVVVPVNKFFAKKSASDWYQIDNGQRCIKQIKVMGESVGGVSWGPDHGDGWDTTSGSSFKVVIGGGHHGGGHGGWDHQPPPPVFVNDAVLTFVGLKAESGSSF